MANQRRENDGNLLLIDRPKTNKTIGGGTGELKAIGAKGETVDRALVPMLLSGLAEGLGGGGIPQVDSTVGAAGDEEAPIGAHGQRGGLAGLLGEREESGTFLLFQDIDVSGGKLAPGRVSPRVAHLLGIEHRPFRRFLHKVGGDPFGEAQRGTNCRDPWPAWPEQRRLGGKGCRRVATGHAVRRGRHESARKASRA